MRRHKLLTYVASVSILAISAAMALRQPDPFTSFTIELNTSGSVYIQWKTTADYKNAAFEIERSADQRKWISVHSVRPQLNTQFSFLDDDPLNGRNYYRIKLAAESAVLYSDVRSINIGDETECYIWPQPATDILHIRVSFSYGTLEIIDGSGRTAEKRSITGFRTDVPINHLPSGGYFLRIKTQDKIWIKKFIKQ